MKNSFLFYIVVASLLATLSSFCHVQAADEFDPVSIIHRVEDSSDMSLGSQLKVLLALSGYHETLGDKKSVEATYNRITSSIPIATIQELAANSGYIQIFTDSLDKSSDPKMRERASSIRSEVIRRALNESQSSNHQNNNMDAFGGAAVTTLVSQLAKAPEFKGLFTAAIQSFPLDRADEQTLFRAKNLAAVIERNREGNLSGAFDERVGLHTQIEDAKADLESLMEKNPQTQDDEIAIKATSKDIENMEIELEKVDAVDRGFGKCWTDPRVPLDDSVVKSFTCASIAIALSESLDSREAYDLLETVIKRHPFSNFAQDCVQQDFHLKDRKAAVEKAEALMAAADPARCEIPENLEKAQLAAMGETSYNATFEFGDCSQYIRELGDIKNAIDFEGEFRTCVQTLLSPKTRDPSCLDHVENEAATLSDEKAVPLLAEIANKKFETPGANDPEGTLVNAVSRFEHFSSSLLDSKTNQAISFERDKMLSKIDAAFSQFVSSSWKKKKDADKLQGFVKSADFAQKISDPGLRNLLLVHVVERFAEGGSQLKFSDPTLDNPY